MFFLYLCIGESYELPFIKRHVYPRDPLIKQIDDSLIQEVTTFDVYEGENIPKDKKSVAINVTLQATDKTLTENDLDQISKKIIQVVNEKTGATIRS